jgi:hypothetical protein
LSPVLGGLLLLWQWPISSVFLAVAVPAFLAAVFVLLVGYFASMRGTEREAAPHLLDATARAELPS